MNVLILGSGGREHALAWKISQSTILDKLYAAPGNPGIGKVAILVEINPLRFNEVLNFCLKKSVEMVIVGPEAPLAMGIVDFFANDKRASGILVVGPSAAGAKLESSKSFAKEFMLRHKIPTARHASFDVKQVNEAEAHLKKLKAPFVIKADGLAAGKGVVIAQDVDTASSVVKQMLVDDVFGEAGRKILIEEFLKGIELSVFVVTDGINFLLLPEAKDYKKIGDGDTGPNTGGMGAVSPVPFADSVFMDKVKNRIIIPTVKGLAKEQIQYKGIIFFGIMNVKGEPYVIEYNCRLGDPEAEAIIPRIKSDLVYLLSGLKDNTLGERDLELDERCSATVVIASGGYPGEYAKGKLIKVEAPAGQELLFHSGTALRGEKLVTLGGRVMAVTALGKDLPTAMKRTYAGVEKVSFEKKTYRKDIGQDLLP